MKKLKMGGAEWTIRPDDLPVTFVDLVTEARVSDGVVYLSLASSIEDAGSNEAVMAARHRMSYATAKAIHAGLGKLFALADPQPTKAGAN